MRRCALNTRSWDIGSMRSLCAYRKKAPRSEWVMLDGCVEFQTVQSGRRSCHMTESQIPLQVKIQIQMLPLANNGSSSFVNWKKSWIARAWDRNITLRRLPRHHFFLSLSQYCYFFFLSAYLNLLFIDSSTRQATQYFIHTHTLAYIHNFVCITQNENGRSAQTSQD